MRLLINLVRPKFFIPIHGDYRHLRLHAKLAMETGAVEHAILLEDGDVLELDKDDARKRDKVTTGRVLIDSGSSIDVVEDLVIRDRRVLSEDGVVLAVLAINKKTGKVERAPEVIMRGFGGADVTDQARELVLKTLDGLSLEEKSDYGMVNEKVRVELKRLIQKTTGRRPMIMPVILEI
jgi:ribonuclease J